MNHLARLVESKSGSRPVSCSVAELRSRLGHDVFSMRADGFDSTIVAEHEAFNAKLDEFLAQPQLRGYLGELTPTEEYVASGVCVLPLDKIRDEIGADPGVTLFPHGYMPLATSVGGHALCFHAPTGCIYWADHSSFIGDEICYQDRSTGEYKYVPFIPANIEQALVLLGNDLETFLRDLLLDKLDARLDKLDLGVV